VDGADRQGVGLRGERAMSARRDLSAPIRRLALNSEEAATAKRTTRLELATLSLGNLGLRRRSALG
jgi:hypothetical protein